MITEVVMSFLLRSSLLVAFAASTASADQILLDFEQADLVGDTISDQFEDLGVTFEGRLFDHVDIGDYDVVVPTIRDLRGLWGSDHDVEALSTGFGLGSVSIGFEAMGGAFDGLSFLVARVVTQDITVLARDAVTGQIHSHTFYGASGGDSLGRVVEEFEVELDALFLTGGDSSIWSEIAVHNHGGMFGVDNIAFQSVVVVPGVAPGLAGVLGLVALRRRRR